MTPTRVNAETQASLPQLSGGLLWVYRALWGTLAIAALAVAAGSFVHPDAQPAIVAIRCVKGAVIMAVSAILLRRRHRDPVAALLALAFLTWAITSSFDFAATETVPQLLDRARFLLFALALLLFPDGEWRPGWTRHVAIASAVVFVAGVAETLRLIPTHLFLPLAIACVLAAIASLVSRFRNAGSEALRQQLKWVALGLVSGIALILCARAGAADMPMPVLWEAMFQLGIVLIALGFLISLLRYRLYDAETAISRSATLAVLTIALVATFSGTEAAIEWLGQQYLGMGIGNISAAMAAAVAAVLLTPLHNRIGGWAEQHFQRDLVTLKRDLPELLDAMAASTSVRRFADTVLPPIEQAVQSTRLALIVDGRVVAARGIGLTSARKLVRGWRAPEAEAMLSRCDGDSFPLTMALRCPLGSIRGWLLLGTRPDGSFFGKDDLDALAQIALPLQRTLFLVAEREAWERRRRTRDRLTQQAVMALTARLDALEAPGGIDTRADC